MFGYRSASLILRFTTNRMVVRLVNDQDDYRLAEYYQCNRTFLKPWEPTRDSGYYSAAGWKSKLAVINELHKHKEAYYFILLSADESEIYGTANFSNVLRGSFYSCYLGYSLGEKLQGSGLMYEALQPVIHHIQRHELMHRIMANYMPHNYRSGNLLTRLGFVREGYAKDYLQIDGQWCDHVLTALTDTTWLAPR